MKRKILILNGQYWPGYKGGGPIRSLMNLVENLGDTYEFFVITSDRDFKDNVPYSNVKIGEWNNVGKAKVYYLPPERQTFRGLREIINSVDYDILYLNGFFSPIFTIKPLILRRLGLLRKDNIILTPRGDFTGGLKVKRLRKYLYIYLAKLIGLYKDIYWHATSELEKNNIKNVFLTDRIFTAENLAMKIDKNKYITYTPQKLKEKGMVKLVFISRIAPKKNLHFALETLKEVKGNVIFDIYGPIEDKNYWKKCQRIINTLPSNIEVKYKGEIAHEDVIDTFKEYHGFYFPTLGENYGHIILEALLGGCVLIISDQTPWRSLEDKGIGWDLNLKDKDSFISSINYLIKLDSEEINQMSKNAFNYGLECINNAKIIDKYVNMFETILR
jgi:glycosyltransferase involved in cell wall biosynthesis